MMRSSLVGALLLGATLIAAGCAPRVSPIDFETGAAAQVATGDWRLASVEVKIPEKMKVNEDGNVRVPPPGELVWWGDPPGDRKAQVRALLSDAATAGAQDALTGTKPVVFRVKVNRFHALTPLARSTGIQLGVHSLNFDFEVVDAATGEVLVVEKGVNADLRAFSGTQAILAEQQGQGQKIRIQTRVAQVVRSWLTS